MTLRERMAAAVLAAVLLTAGAAGVFAADGTQGAGTKDAKPEPAKNEEPKVDPKKEDPKPEPKSDPKTEPKAEPKTEPKDPKTPDPAALEAHNEVRKALQGLLAGVKDLPEFNEKWKKEGAAFETKVLDFLKAHPGYEEGHESMLILAISMANRLGTEDTAVRILEQIRKNHPAGPIGKKADEAILDIKERLAFKAGSDRPVEMSFVPLGKGEADRIDLKNLRGKVVVIYFWAAWCDVCGFTTEELKKVYEKHNGKGLEVIGVSLDDDKTKVEEAVKAAKIPWPVQFDGRLWYNEYARKFAVNTIPTVYVLDKSGKVVGMSGRQGLEDMLPKLLEAKYEPPAGGKKPDEKKPG